MIYGGESGEKQADINGFLGQSFFIGKECCMMRHTLYQTTNTSSIINSSIREFSKILIF